MTPYRSLSAWPRQIATPTCRPCHLWRLVPPIDFGAIVTVALSIFIVMSAPDCDSLLQSMSPLARVLSDHAVLAQRCAAEYSREERAILDAATDGPDTQNHQTT